METAASRTRRALAHEVARAYAANPAVDAVLLGGSAGRGEADRFSDVELGVFWHRPPAERERADAIAAVGGDLERLYPFDDAVRQWFDDWKLGRRGDEPKTGISVESVHMTTADAEDAIAAVLERHDPDPEKQLLLAALADGPALHGEPQLGRWRVRAADYPEGLARAVVASSAQIDHFWRLETARERRNPLLAYRTLVDAHERLLRTLLAVNRVYWFGFKSLDAIANRLELAPPRLAERIRAAYAVDLDAAEPIVAALVEETYDLVESHLPGVDVDRLRRIFRYRRPLWEEAPGGRAASAPTGSPV